MSGDDWLLKVQKMKQKEKEIEANLEVDRKTWEELKEKYKNEASKILGLLNRELKKVVEVYTDPSLGDYDKPKVEGDYRYVSLSIPIVHGGSYGSSHYSFGISFWLKLTENGYLLEVIKSMYSVRDYRPYEYKGFVQPPVTEESIQKEVMDVLQARNEAIRVMAEKDKHFP